jgi:hypothetical protein
LRLQLIGVLLEESLCMISWIDQESRTDDTPFIFFLVSFKLGLLARLSFLSCA